MDDVGLAIALGAAFLYAFYRAVEAQWPASYFAVQPGLLLSVTQSPWRFIAFRFFPIFVTSVFIAVSVERAHGDALLAVVGVAAAHILLSTGRGIYAQLRAPLERRNTALLLFYVAVSLGVLAASIAGYLAAGSLKSVVPQVRELSASLWTALLAGIVGAFLVRISRRGSTDRHAAFRESKRRLDPALWKVAEAHAKTFDADPNLLLAIMLVENLERPAWARKLEHQKGRILRAGSYGVMQISSDHPLTDEESIEIAARERLAGVTVSNPQGHPMKVAVDEAARNYNPDSHFVEAVWDAYQFILSEQRRTVVRLETCPICGDPNAVVTRYQILDGEGVLVSDVIGNVQCRTQTCEHFQPVFGAPWAPRTP